MTTQQQHDGLQPMESQDSDFIGALAALTRAAVKARQRAFDTTGLVAIVKDGKVAWQQEDGTLLGEQEHYEGGLTPKNDRT